jgi:hypothetical protein
MSLTYGKFLSLFGDSYLLLTQLMLDVDLRFLCTYSKFSHLLFLPLRTTIGFQHLATKPTG